MSDYRVTPSREGWIVINKSTRIKTHKSIFRLKKDALEHENNLITLQAAAEPSALKLHEAMTTFIEERDLVACDSSKRLTKGGLSSYKADLNLRIIPYMENVLLSEFNGSHLKACLRACDKNGFPYKTLKRMVRNIRSFLNVMKADGKNPCMDNTKFNLNLFTEIEPSDHGLREEKEAPIFDQTVVGDILVRIFTNKDENFKSALTAAIMTTLFATGLRRSELKGLKRNHVNFETNQLHVKSVYIQKEGGHLHRTKNTGSFRDIDLDESTMNMFKWWLLFLSKNRPHDTWLFPAMREADGPVSDSGLSNIVWQVYSDMGLAEIEFNKGHVKIIKSKLKWFPTKVFRHTLGHSLIEAMNSNRHLTKNYIKSTMGHDKFTTSQDIYGNHKAKITLEKTAAKSKATNTGLIPDFSKIN
tara:strand:- start:2988 stop:4232 length:1245 start_codon:yes stop_codon:yes gene_type:complete